MGFQILYLYLFFDMSYIHFKNFLSVDTEDIYDQYCFLFLKAILFHFSDRHCCSWYLYWFLKQNKLLISFIRNLHMWINSTFNYFYSFLYFDINNYLVLQHIFIFCLKSHLKWRKVLYFMTKAYYYYTFQFMDNVACLVHFHF